MDLAEMIFASCCEGEEELKEKILSHPEASEEEKFQWLEEYHEIYNFSCCTIRKFERLIMNNSF